MTTQRRHAVIIGMGLMGCDIAAIFLAGGCAKENDEGDDPGHGYTASF